MVIDKEIEVRYAETDQMGIVYHANYLVWFEMARTALGEAIGYPYARCEESGYLAPVTEMRVEYGAPMRYGEVAVVRVRLIKLTPVRSTYAYEVYRKGEEPGVDRPHVTARSMHCTVDAESFKPVNFKKAMPDMFEAYRGIVESGFDEDRPRRR